MTGKRSALFGALSLVGIGALPVVAAPTVGELRDTCTRALAEGYVGERAAMCDWYVAPCGTCGRDGPPTATWCVPAGTPAARVAAQVVEDLVGTDATRAAPAAVEEILRRRYPCPAGE